MKTMNKIDRIIDFMMKELSFRDESVLICTAVFWGMCIVFGIALASVIM